MFFYFTRTKWRAYCASTDHVVIPFLKAQNINIHHIMLSKEKQKSVITTEIHTYENISHFLFMQITKGLLWFIFFLLEPFALDSKPYWIALEVCLIAWKKSYRSDVMLDYHLKIVSSITLTWDTDIRLHFDNIRILWKLIDETAIFQSFLYQKHYIGWRKSNNGNLCDHITICKVGFPHYIWNVCVSSFLQNIT